MKSFDLYLNIFTRLRTDRNRDYWGDIQWVLATGDDREREMRGDSDTATR